MTCYFINKGTLAWRNTMPYWASDFDPNSWEQFRFDRAVIYDETDRCPMDNRPVYYFRLPRAALPYVLLMVPKRDVHRDER
jgi:hypothetical protein